MLTEKITALRQQLEQELANNVNAVKNLSGRVEQLKLQQEQLRGGIHILSVLEAEVAVDNKKEESKESE